MKKPTRGDIMGALFATYDDGRMSDRQKGEKMLGYSMALAPIPDDELAVVVQQVMAVHKYPTVPLPAELLEMWRQLHSSVGAGDAAAKGWVSVKKAMRDERYYMRAPSYKDPFKDPIVAKVVEVMGWRELRLSEEPGNDMARFIRCYDAIAAQEVADQRLLAEYKQMRAEHQEQLEQKETTGYAIVKRKANP
jgi:hypothetical protein